MSNNLTEMRNMQEKRQFKLLHELVPLHLRATTNFPIFQTIIIYILIKKKKKKIKISRNENKRFKKADT